MKHFTILLSLALVALLVGCGGGGGGNGGNNPPDNPNGDTTGPVIRSFSATYNELTESATFVAVATDPSGIKTVQAFINNGSIATNMYLSSTNTYTGVLANVPENYSGSEMVYLVTIYATDTKGNTSSANTSFTVPPFGPPPPPDPPT